MAKAKSIPATTVEQPATIEACGEIIWRALQFTGLREDHNDDKLPFSEQHAIKRRQRELLDLQYHLEDRIFHMLALTPQEAMIQLARMGAEVEQLDSDTTLTEYEKARSMRRIERALYSIMRWIERTHRVDRPSVCEWYMSHAADPWFTLRSTLD